MASILVPLAPARAAASSAPLRRSMPQPAAASRLHTALLALAGVVVLVDIEFALAYLLYFAVQLAR